MVKTIPKKLKKMEKVGLKRLREIQERKGKSD